MRCDMSIDIDLTEEELAELREYTKQENLSEIVQTAVKEFIRYKQRMKLIELSDRVEMDEDLSTGRLDSSHVSRAVVEF